MVISGAGAAGVACANLLHVRWHFAMSPCSTHVAFCTPDRDDMTRSRRSWPQRTNPRGLTGGMVEALDGADVFLGVSGGVVPEELIATMAPEGIVFALSNPDPEIRPRRRGQARRGGRHRAKRLSQPDQQRAGVPRRVSRCAGRRRPQDHREDEGGRRRGDRLGRRRRLSRQTGSSRARWTRGLRGRWLLRWLPRRAEYRRSDVAGAAGRAARSLRRWRVSGLRASRRRSTAQARAGGRVPARCRVGAAGRHLHRRAALLRIPGPHRAGIRPADQAGLRGFCRRARLHRSGAAAFLSPAPPRGPTRRSTRRWCGALPEGIAAGDYTTAADDKPALVVTESTAKSWGGNDLSALPRHCDGIVIGSIAGASTPAGAG